MEILCIPIWLYLLAILMGLMVYYMWFMSKDLNLFERMKIDGPGPMPILGNLGHVLTSGLYQSQLEMYTAYKDRKVFGFFDARTPCLFVTDLDLIKEILVDHFDNFPNRQRFVYGHADLHHCLPLLQVQEGDHRWHHVRNAVDLTLNDPDLLRKAAHSLEKINQDMVYYLQYQIEEEEDPEVDLRELAHYFNVECVLSTCFGIEANAFQYPEYNFMAHVRSINFTLWLSKMVHFFCPFFGGVCRFLGICSCVRTVRYFNKLTDAVISDEKENNVTFLKSINQHMLKVNRQEQGEKEGTSPGMLSDSDVKGQAFSLLLSSYNTVPTVMSYTLFMLTNNPECRKKVHDEIDAILEHERNITIDNVGQLVYLDMCIKETMRLFPCPVNMDRVCRKDITIRGFKFPKGMPVFLPVYSIHRDPDYWSDPEEFRPERFDPDSSTTRHFPLAFLPFGAGPRKCAGEKWALLQMKLGIAAVMRRMKLSPCTNTVYPVKLSRFSNKASDVMWVQMDLKL